MFKLASFIILKKTEQRNTLRIRPLTDRDRARPRFANLANDDVLKIHDKTIQVVPQNKLFTFDHVFGTESTQNEIFTNLGERLIRKFIEGYNITILAYGQTSSGKTYTMGSAFHGHQMNSESEGIIPRSMALLFDLLHNNTNDTLRPISPSTSSVSSSTTTSSNNSKLFAMRPSKTINSVNVRSTQPAQKTTRFTVKVSFIEIYNEELHDLLNSAPPDELPPITIREDTKGRIYWTGVKEVLVHNTDDVMHYLEQGTQNRATGATDMNEKSSRSHAIFSVSLKQEKWVASDTGPTVKRPTRPTSSLSSRSSTPSNKIQEDGEWFITTSKFHFVDLAGSERLKRTAAEGDRRREGININGGLLALGNVISALGDASKKNVHVPYRDSKLTRLLQDSLGGNATTLMIACVSPLESNLSETLNTLQYANRARNIKNRSERNQQEEWMVTDNIELLRSLIGKLKTELNYVKGTGAGQQYTRVINSNGEEHEQQIMVISDLQRQLEELEGEVTVTRERNRIVERELQRLRLIEASASNLDFQHLVEPVIEEYEKSVAKLESQLALTKAAMTHSDMGYEEQHSRVLQLETTIRHHEQTMNELQSRLSKVLEREQSNEAYIRELETKLLKSAQETSKDQEMLNDLKLRIMKLKETDENTEQYILGLEQRLAASDQERAQLVASVDALEAKVELKERSNLELMERLSRMASDGVAEKLILKELDDTNARLNEVQQERDALQEKINQLQQQQQQQQQPSTPVEVAHSEDQLIDPKKSQSSESFTHPVDKAKEYKNHRSFAEEKETTASVAVLKLTQTEERLKEESERANHLQLTLNRLQHDHAETIKELDEVTQRYHELSEQLEFLEQRSSSSTVDVHEYAPAAPSLDLSKEIAQAKDEAHEQEKIKLTSKITLLESRIISLTNEIDQKDAQLSITKSTVEELELELSNHRTKLPGVEFSQQTGESLLEQKQQEAHWKLAYNQLQQDMEKLMIDLDGKEVYIEELQRKFKEENDRREALLQVQLDESNQQMMSLQKRLAESLASLTVLKLAHDGLEKKLVEQTNNSKNEISQLIGRHRNELDDVRQAMGSKLTKEAVDHKAAIDTLQLMWEEKLKDHAEKLQSGHLEEISKLTHKLETTCNQLSQLERELIDSKSLYETFNNDHVESIKKLTQKYESSSCQLEDELTNLKEELVEVKKLNDKLIADHEAEIVELSSSFEAAACQLEDEVKELKSELEKCKILHEEMVSSNSEELQRVISGKEELKHKLKLSERQVDELEHQLESLHASQEKALNEQARQINTLVVEHNQIQQNLRNEQNRSQAELDKLKPEHAQQLQKLEANNNHTVSKLQALQSDYDKLILEHTLLKELLETERQSSKAQLAELQVKLVTKSSPVLPEMIRLPVNNERVSERIALLESQLDAAKTEQEKSSQVHQKTTKTAKKQVEDLEQRLLDECQKNASLVEDIFTLKEQYTNKYKLIIHDLNYQHKRELEAIRNGLEDRQKTETCHQEREINDDSESKLNELDIELSRHSEVEDNHVSIALLESKITQVLSELDVKNKCVEQQQSQINQLAKELEESKRLYTNATVIYKQRISSFEEQIGQVQEENAEYASLSAEFEKEIQRITLEKDQLADALDTAHTYNQNNMNEIKEILEVNDYEGVLKKIKELTAKSTSIPLISKPFTGSKHDELDHYPSMLPKNSNNGEDTNKIINDLKGELEIYRNRLLTIQDDESKIAKKLEDMQEQQLQERQKLLQTEQSKKKLEKQLEQLLSKRSSFMCF
ncbi:MAG: hypothetical protein EXX96DRAFT_608332 [Benjaminiella poitrasii]|nr:MAG: hypothetical protein EXX96DRAFT_608332 [Benjaminiella poitrasii]